MHTSALPRATGRWIFPVILLCLGSFSGRPLHAHDAITSTVTFQADLLPIFRARCISCHRQGGSAFSLETYADARPWAKAIEEEVLRRRMPPWGAVPGFGEFRNDPSLTMTELQQIAEWAEGGAPEGDPVEGGALASGPSAAGMPRPDSPWPQARALEVVGGSRLPRAIRLAAVMISQAPPRSTLRLLAERPDGGRIPLLWIASFSPAISEVFEYRQPLLLPAGTVIRGLPLGAAVKLFPASPRSRARAAASAAP